jgi:hypothetical protein
MASRRPLSQAVASLASAVRVLRVTLRVVAEKQRDRFRGPTVPFPSSRLSASPFWSSDVHRPVPTHDDKKCTAVLKMGIRNHIASHCCLFAVCGGWKAHMDAMTRSCDAPARTHTLLHFARLPDLPCRSAEVDFFFVDRSSSIIGDALVSDHDACAAHFYPASEPGLAILSGTWPGTQNSLP